MSATRDSWRHDLDGVRVKTPSPSLDLMVNGWLGYQTMACRLQGRSALYQSGGAFGFRDQLQDVMALLYADPGLARGHILLAVNNEGQFLNLLKCIGREDILEDPRFKDWPSRIENEPAMRAIIEEAFAEADAETWEERLAAAGAPASRINTLADAVAHPQLEHRDVIQKVDGPYGEMTLIGSGFQLAHGGGGTLTSRLIDRLFVPAFRSPHLDALGDGAVTETVESVPRDAELHVL